MKNNTDEQVLFMFLIVVTHGISIEMNQQY